VVRGNSDARLPNAFGRPSVEILHQSDLLRKPVEPKSPAGAGASEGGNQMAAAHENRRGYAGESS